MIRLPGLTRQDDRPSVDGANRGRVQVRNPIGDVSLQPQARPVDTYSRPQAPNSGPSGLEQLAGALAQVSPSLQNFLDNSAANAKQEAEDRAMRRIGGMSFAEAREAVDGGKMSELENPWFKAAFMKQYGERLAYERVNELTKEYETNFDKNSGDLDGFIRERTAADLDQYGDSAHFTGAYNKVMDGFSSRANTAQAQYQTEQVKEDTVSGVYDTFLGEAKSLRADGKDPQEIITALLGRYEGNRKLLHVDFKEQDREMVRLAEAFAADGDVKMVDAIFNSERRGADGTVLGTLGSNREFQADAQRIAMSARRKLEENNGEAAFDARMTFSEQARTGNLDQEALLAHREKNPGAFTDTQVLSLIGQNDGVLAQQADTLARAEHKLYLEKAAAQAEEDLIARNIEAARTGMLPFIEEAEILTATGETKTVSVEDQKKTIAKRIVDQSEWAVKNGKSTPEEAFGLQVETFSVNNLVNQKWGEILRGGPKAATQFTLSGGAVPPLLKDGVDMYMRLHSANPKLLDTHIKDSSDRDFYEAYRIATQYLQLAPEQAMQMAMMQTSDPERPKNPGVQSRLNEVEARIHDIRHGGTWYNFYRDTITPSNRGYIAAEVSRLGRFYVQSGMDADDALDEAKSRFLNTHTEVGGNFVRTAGKDVPPNFGELAEYALKKYAEDFGEAEGLEADDLTIRPVTDGNGWIIVHQVGQFPVEQKGRSNLTLRLLHELDMQRREEAKQGVVKEHDRNQRDRAAGIMPIDKIIPPMPGGLFSGDRAEAIRKREEEDEQEAGAAKQGEDDSLNLPSIDKIFPPVKGGLFTGKRYEELNKSTTP